MKLYHITDSSRTKKISSEGLKINQSPNPENIVVSLESYGDQRYEVDATISDYFKEKNLSTPKGFVFFFKNPKNAKLRSSRSRLTVKLPPYLSEKCWEADKIKSDDLFDAAGQVDPLDWEWIENSREKYKNSIRPLKDYGKDNYNVTEVFCPFEIPSKYIKKIE